MKRLAMVGILSCLVLGLAVMGYAKPRIYKWVEDKRVTSSDVLSKTQSKRVIPIMENQALGVVEKIMTDDLFLGLAAYRTTRHQQEAETTGDSVLPEEMVGQREVELIDEDYRFILKVKLKKYGSRTRVDAEARPVYRLRDYDAEAERDEDTETYDNTVEVKIKADNPSAIALGPIIVAPIFGVPADYGITPLPDAAERAGDLVRSFMYFLDRRVQAQKSDVVEPEAEPAEESPAAPPEESTVAPAGDTRGAGGVEVDVKIKTRQPR